MKKHKVFIDGETGTVGLQIHSRLKSRNDIEILTIPRELSENLDQRKKLINQAEFVFLCLPDEIAKQSVSVIENPDVRVIDASTAHRTNPEWDYGFPELSKEHKEKIRTSKRVAVPGCYASGFIALIYPLVKASIIPKDHPISCFGISGYSGAGKAFIAEYENSKRHPDLKSGRFYALSQSHKHQPEMQVVCGLERTPMFNPIIDDYYGGMIVSVPLQGFSKAEIETAYKNNYKTGNVKYIESYDEPFLAANALSGSDEMEIYAFGNDERVLLTARFDNLGKGASGAAVQCFDIMVGEK